MADTLSKTRRSWNMSQIRSKNTTPEKIVRSALHGLGLRFRLESTHLPCRPDIILAKHKTVIFVHGCFWHRHSGCKYSYKPKTRVDFWEDKFRQNIQRDLKNEASLKELGWNVVTIWECETKDADKLAAILKNLIS
ncbi:MAG: very short patch repair endonuclease [Candidatus Riflebacteria bacterium HGW-Riflebacteria-2]|nr:MAG: very short patch repair endonuclease [Candidatus Riflebacteria bacterium HGW-Riflebacteria-2]